MADVDEILDEWEARREQGQDLSAEELTSGRPDLLPEVEQGIRAIKGTDWMFGQDDDQEDSFFCTVSSKDDETKKNSSRPLDEFLQAIIQSGLMTADAVNEIHEQSNSENSLSLATCLITQNRLTAYQADVLLEGRNDPLILEKYIILDTIDSGGMGVVFKALHRTMDRIVALKTLPGAAVDSPDKVKRFQQETRAAAKLHHPNIVTAFDAVSANGVHFLVMEYVKGRDLKKVVDRQGPLPVQTAVGYLLQSARGLEHAHEQRVVHRDVKPANLLLDEQGTVKVLDMGLARIASPDDPGESTTAHELTQAGSVMGTVGFMAPEQALDTRMADHRSDVYSLGCTLFFLLTGRAPYRESTPIKTLMAHREQPIPSLSAIRNDVPPKLIAVFECMVAKKPEDRFQSMKELVSVLEDCHVEDNPKTLRAAGDSARVKESAETVAYKPMPKRRSPRNNRLIAASLAGILLMGLLAGIFIKIQTSGGTIVIESSHSDVEVFIDDQQAVTITDPRDKTKIKIEVKPGEHTLKVTKGGFEAHVAYFSLKGQNGKPINVKLVPKNVATVPNKEADVAGSDKERRVAEWVLGIGGSVHLLVDGETVLAKSLEEIPKGPFKFVAIYLDHNKKVVDSDLSRFSGLTSLKRLQLYGTGVSDDGIAQLDNLPSLTTLQLSDTKITDRSLQRLHKFAPNLGYVGLVGTKVTDDGIKHLKKLPKLDLVQAHINNVITDAGLATLLTTNVRRLSLSSRLITGEGLKVLTSDSKIRELGLGGTSVKDKWLKHLAGVPLESLSLGNTPISDDAVEHLRSMKKLKSLHLVGSKVTAKGIQTLRQALPKCEISWDGDKIDAKK